MNFSRASHAELLAAGFVAFRTEKRARYLSRFGVVLIVRGSFPPACRQPFYAARWAVALVRSWPPSREGEAFDARDFTNDTTYQLTEVVRHALRVPPASREEFATAAETTFRLGGSQALHEFLEGAAL